MTTRRFLGYDWFKLIVAVILALLLLVLGMGGTPSTATIPATSTAAPTSAAVAAAPTTAATLAPTTAPSVAPTVAATLSPTTAATIAPTTAQTTAATPTSAVAVDATSTLPAPSLDPPGDTPPSAGSVTLTGTGAPGGQVEVIVDGTLVGKAPVNADGTWALSTSLTAGDHEIVVRALDASGSVIAESPATKRTVGASSPSGATATSAATPASTAEPITATSNPATATPAPATTATPVIGGASSITFPSDSAQVPAGPLTLRGTGTPGSALEVLDSDKVLGTVTVSADGTWTLPITSSDGTAAYSVRPAGSQEVSAKPIRVTIGAGQPTTSSSLTVGNKAWVTRANGRSLRLRAGAGLTKTVITRLPVGTELTLLEGPQPQDGYTWWRVRTLGGQTGWVAGEELRTQPD